MPVISSFFGVVIMLYYFGNKKHQLPHIHVECSGDEAVIGIPDGNVIEGELRKNKLRLVQAWVEIHREDLIADWELAVNGKPIFKIEPLR